MRQQSNHCARIHRSLSAFLDGEVDSGQAGSIQRHLAGCGLCAHQLEGLIHVSAASYDLIGGGSPAALAPTPDRFARIVRRLLENRRLCLRQVLRRVLAGRTLRSAGSDSAQAFGRGPGAEERLLGKVRSLAHELSELHPGGNRLALASLDRWLKGGSYEDLRNTGLLGAEPSPPWERSPGDGWLRVLNDWRN